MGKNSFTGEIGKHAWMKSVPGGPAAAAGVKAHGVHCGLKPGGALDLSLFVSEAPCKTVAFYTENKLLGAHIPVFRDKLKASHGLSRALLVNSKNANCATGKKGIKDNLDISSVLADSLGVDPGMVLLASTGVIGARLNTKKITGALDGLVSGLKSGKRGGDAAARGIMTTDTRPKICAVQVTEGKKTYHIGGVAKGAGMIYPQLATMFSFIYTDADIALPSLRKMSKKCVDETYNSISIDGDTSPNDTVMVMANGMSGVKIKTGAATERFRIALEAVARWLCMEIVRDGEGATKLVHIEITGAESKNDAVLMARSISNSMLVKTAIFGKDPNWGRIVSAAGVSGAEFDPGRAILSIDDAKVYDRGRLPAIKKKIMNNKDIYIRLDAGLGRGEARFWTCDLSYDYVKINAEYTT